MKRIIPTILMVSMLSGCAHCSVTITDFTGKTKGINPYGDGNVVVARESYWGNLQCILDLIDRNTKDTDAVKRLK